MYKLFKILKEVKLIFIAHRGNVGGPSNLENKPEYILKALQLGFHVEVDVWFLNEKLYLGHDLPQYQVDHEFLRNIIEKTFIHCKNIDALDHFSSLEDKFNFFWHDSDCYTLTSMGQIWTYPGKELKRECIAVMPEIKMFENIFECSGICTDFPEKYRRKFSLVKEAK